MSLDVNSIEYIEFEKQIKRRRADAQEWKDIYSLGCDDDIKLQEKLDMIAFNICVDNITVEDWKKIVDNVKLDEENGKDTDVVFPQVMVPNKGNNLFEVDNHKGSAWHTYKNILIKKGFDESTIRTIESSSTHILNKLSNNTIYDGPIKGLVIGNVQSGKTANMAALMAMAADVGFNMFIVLSGTIENLRRQTQERLYDDLWSATNVNWTMLDNVNTGIGFPYPLRRIQSNDKSRQRYFMVCLKNSKRLSNLLNWLSDDLNTRSQLKILLIDDESDQAGVNTADITDGERTRINDLLVKIVHNKDDNGNVIEKPYKAINYIGYTATPYANILNESPGENSLYPSDFVACLEVSNSYFGPQRIFGLPEQDMDGMNIINKIDDLDIETLRNIYDGDIDILPKSLCDALYWFYCTFAVRKSQNVHKPVSMLIHTSSKQNDHSTLYKAVTRWFSKHKWKEFENKCKEIYDQQTKQFSYLHFEEAYSNYMYEIQDYPSFEEIREDLKSIFDNGIKQIKLQDKDGRLEFSEGVHLCIDNCAHNSVINDNEIFRLFYPSENSPVNFTTGFIVIGGATLSRGLTIEGLTCSYFLKSVKNCDTLMQMGRWFGYRKGYELLPRIWLTDSTKNQFEFLSILDYELRMEMKEMELFDLKPGLVGIKVNRHPKKRFLDITSKNKMHDLVEVDADFSGMRIETTVFYGDEEVLKSNYDNTLNLIKNIGNSTKLSSQRKSNNTYVWECVGDDIIMDYLHKMKYPKNSKTFLDVELFSNSYRELAKEIGIEGWNVVLAGVEDSNAVNKISDFGGFNVSTVNRSQLNKSNDGLIRIGALRNPKDIYEDIDINNPALTEKDRKAIITSDIKDGKYKLIRKSAGLDNKSLLVIYVIDHNSKVKLGKTTSRENLNTKNDVIGLMMLIPERSDGTNKGTKVTIRLNDLDDIGEVEG